MPRGRGRGRSSIANSRRRCEVHNWFMAADGVCSRCQESERDQENVTDVNPPIPPDAPNDEETPEVETTSVEMCEKCCRTTTDEYRLDFQTIHRDSLHTTMFGKPVAEMTTETVILCQQCNTYNSSSTRHKDWPNAWPSVMYTLLFETYRFKSNTEKFYTLLPHEIKLSFKTNMSRVLPSVVTNNSDSTFRDITKERDDFCSLIGERSAKSFVEAVSKYSFPNVRCPAGCFEFIEKIGSISFAHFLNYLYPLFTSFGADSRKFLKGARMDFLKPVHLLDTFTVTPCVFNTEKGLQLGTCSDHGKGILLKYVHVPTNPAVGNISPKHGDRLALMVSSVRSVRPLKIGTKSATFTMCRVDSGKISGVSSTVLHNFRNFEIPFTKRLIDIEKLMITSRNDIKDVVRQCFQNEEISKALAEGFLNYETSVSLSTIEDHCRKAISFPMTSLMRMKDYVESCPGDLDKVDEFKKPLVFGHKNDSFGFEPSVIPKTISELPTIFNFVLIFLNTDSLWSKLLQVASEHVQLENLCKFLHRLRQNKLLNKNQNIPLVREEMQTAITELFGSQSVPLISVCEKLTGCQIIHTQRTNVNHVRIDCSRHDVVLIVASESCAREVQILFDLSSINGKNFQLSFICRDEQVSFRHGSPFFGFWTVKNDGSRAFKDPTLEYQYNRNWKYLVYVSQSDLGEETKLRYLKYMGGQGVFSARNKIYHFLQTILKVTENVACPKTQSITAFVLENQLGGVPRKTALRPFVRNTLANFVTLTTAY